MTKAETAPVTEPLPNEPARKKDYTPLSVRVNGPGKIISTTSKDGLTFEVDGTTGSETAAKPQSPKEIGDGAAVLRGCPNESARQMSICEPWTFTPNIPENARRDKEAYNEWRARPTTGHLFFSASVGLNPDLRVNREINPLCALHGLIADYDAEITLKMISLVENMPVENQPNWMSRTFSGGVRLLWMFEERLGLNNRELLRAFLNVASEQLNVKGLLPGLDKAAWQNADIQLHDVGHKWQELNPEPVAKSKVHYWLYLASRRVKDWKTGETKIPLEAVAEEVERQYPGAWTGGEFTEGARGNAFWDFGANPTSCIVAEDGMVCFSREKAFFRWSEILGLSFVRKYEQERVGNASREAYFDGRRYWRRVNGLWQWSTQENRALRLERHYKFERTEVKDSLLYTQDNCRVAGAVPVVHDEREIVEINGRRLLNISHIKAMRPAEKDDPKISGWLHEYFENVWSAPREEQRDYFLAWFKRFYQGALAGRPLSGQAVVISGDVGLGKTFLSWRIIGAALGGHSDGANFLKGETSFNKELVEVPVMAIDDSTVADDVAARTKLSSAFKKHVADPQISYHPKGVDSMSVPYHGRIILTCNKDPYSLGILPRLDTSTADKLMFFKFGGWQANFDLPEGAEAHIRGILPYWLAWLLKWEPPAYVLSDRPRFGIKAYQHPDLVERVEEDSPQATLKHLIDTVFKRSSFDAKDVERGAIWFTARDLRDKILGDYGIPSARDALFKELGGRRLGHALSSLGEDYILNRRRHRTNVAEYLIKSPEHPTKS